MSKIDELHVRAPLTRELKKRCNECLGFGWSTFDPYVECRHCDGGWAEVSFIESLRLKVKAWINK